MTQSVDHHLSEIDYCVAEVFKAQPLRAHWRHSPPAQPAFSAAAVLTLAVRQGIVAGATLTQTSRLVAQNGRAAFPPWPASNQGLARVPHRLPHGGGLLATTGTPPPAARLSLVDSTPIALWARRRRVRRWRAAGADCGKPRTGGCCGLKLPVLRHLSGRVLKLLLTPGTCEDREPAGALVQRVEGGVRLGDWGSRGVECTARVAQEAELLRMTREQAPAHQFLLSQGRQGIETTFSQLGRQCVDRVVSRSWHGLWHTLHLKVLYYNLLHAGIVSA